WKIMQTDPDAVLLVLPSDHIIVGDINATISRMLPATAEGRIVTFGVPPGYAETGYGYIMNGGEDDCFPGLYAVDQFIEKPPVDVARALIATGRAHWASGISMFRADVICA
ncbi:MAG: sugar phosphate nucleotidyltransferase, partial [Casimicrobiaceae bacterium]